MRTLLGANLEFLDLHEAAKMGNVARFMRVVVVFYAWSFMR